jgi:hypothetical protein
LKGLLLEVFLLAVVELGAGNSLVKYTHDREKHFRGIFSVEAGEISQVNRLFVFENVFDEIENFFGIFLAVVFVVVFAHAAEVETLALASVLCSEGRLLLLLFIGDTVFSGRSF